ncbi:MAG: tetratricopeptide repeat protein [Planctomycetota bacterium]
MSTQFGKYTIEKKLGQGGMGAVYLALDPALNRRVALKIITSASPELLERFQREASAVAKLKHPNIVQVYEAGVINKQHYFTMDYIEGTPLDKLIKDKPKPSIQNMARIIQQVASALHYAHNQKIIHRDIKPANILIDKAGKVYIADFGLAKELTGLDRSLTMSGMALGTPDYMPPEQAQGKKDQIDPRSDIFSLGATLYHCITGRLPFAGKEIYEVLSKVINEDPPTPSSVIKIIPKDLETICLKCLNKDKSKRYQTAGALAQDINRYLEGGQITAKRTSSITKIYLKLMKNKAASLAITVAAVILIAVAIGLMTSSAGKDKEITQYRAEAQKAFEGKNYDEAKTWCNKLLALSPQDEGAQSLLKKSEKIIKAQEDKKLQEDAKVKEAAAQAQKTVDLRAQAKTVLDRADGAPTPDQKIQFAREALKIDPTYGDAWQVIGYAYRAKAGGAQSLDEYRELIDKAVEAFTKAIETTPTLAYSYYERAMITAYILNKPEEATPDFEMVFKYDPGSHIGWYAKGNIANSQKKYDDAIASFTKAVELMPDYSWAYCNRGNSYSEKGDIDRAIADYTEAIRVDPKLANAYYNRGIIYNTKGEYDKAIADYDETIRIDPKYSQAYCNRGIVYDKKAESLGNTRDKLSPDAYRELLDRAIADYSQAISLNPGLVTLHLSRGIAYGKKGDLDRAIADFTEMTRLNPESADAYSDLGNAYRLKNELDKSIANYTEVIRINPKSAEAYANRGFVYKEKAERERNPDAYRELLDLAMTDADKAIRLDPKLAHAYNVRGYIRVKKGDLDGAIADYGRIISLNPESADAYNNRGATYDIKGESDRAIADFTEVIRINPKSAEAYHNRGAVYERKKDPDRAIADYNEAIKLNPKYAAAYYSRGVAYGRKGQPDRAIADFTEAIRLNPDYANAYYNRGTARLNKGDSDGAIADFAKATALEPDNPSIWYDTACAYARKKNKAEALKNLSQAIKLNGEFKEMAKKDADFKALWEDKDFKKLTQ